MRVGPSSRILSGAQEGVLSRTEAHDINAARDFVRDEARSQTLLLRFLYFFLEYRCLNNDIYSRINHVV